jgi:hypothetical protein
MPSNKLDTKFKHLAVYCRPGSTAAFSSFINPFMVSPAPQRRLWEIRFGSFLLMESN